MDPLTISVLAILALLLLLLAGIPIGYSMTAVGAVGLWIVGGETVAATAMQRMPFTAVVNMALVVIPLFILMGELARIGGVAEDTFQALRTMGGRMRGNLAMATVAACGAFGAVSGSSIATALTIGKPALQEMDRYGYDKRLSLGVVAAGGTLGTLMPPSVILILYALIADVSIADMFLAGVVPALLTVFVYGVVIALIIKLRPSWSPGGPRVTVAQRVKAVPKLGPAVLLGTVVLGSLVFGLVSLTEIAGLGAFLAGVIWLWSKGIRGRDWSGVGEATMAAVRVTSMIGMILIGSHLFTNFLSFSRLPLRLNEFFASDGLGPLGFIVLSVFTFMVLGMFFETMSMMLLTIPFLATAVTTLGLDPIWYGILFVKVAEIGLVTPPVGLNIYVIKGIDPSSKLSDVFAGAAMFIVADIVVIGLIVAFPQIVTFLPTMLARG